jgi:hypothetical protein
MALLRSVDDIRVFNVFLTLYMWWWYIFLYWRLPGSVDLLLKHAGGFKFNCNLYFHGVRVLVCKMIWALLSSKRRGLSQFVLPIRVAFRWRRLWCIGGMILTGQDRRYPRKPSSCFLSLITNLTWIGLGSNSGFWGKRPINFWAMLRLYSIKCVQIILKNFILRLTENTIALYEQASCCLLWEFHVTQKCCVKLLRRCES